MRNPIWRIRALVMVTLLFIAGPAAAQETLRERLIGTWWRPEDESESVGMVLRFRDDGFMTIRKMFSFEGGSSQYETLYARWELENDSLTVAPIRDEDGSSIPSFTVMIAFEDEALILPELDSDERYTFQPGGIPPEAIPEGNALSGTVAYSDGPYYGIVVVAFKFESGEVFQGSRAALLVEGEWELFGLEDGVWFVGAFVFREEDDTIVASAFIVSEAGDVIVVPVEDDDFGFFFFNADFADFADFDGISLEGGQQVMTGIDIVLRAPGTAVEAAAWGDVKALFR